MIFYYCHFGDCSYKSRKFNDVVNHRLEEHGMVRVKNPLIENPAPNAQNTFLAPHTIWAYQSVGEEE